MWFNAITLYPLNTAFSVTPEALLAALDTHRLKPCPPHARQTEGFIAPIATLEEEPYRLVNGCYVLTAAKEIRLLPSSVVHATLEEKVRAVELETSHPIRRAERLKLKEDIEFELLPKAFTIMKKDWLYIDTIKNWVILHNSNPNKAADTMALLTRTLGSIGAAMLPDSPVFETLLQSWLRDPKALPAGLSLREHATLVNRHEDKSQYTCKDIEKNAHEIETLLDEGYAVTSIDLTWLDRMQFTLTSPFAIKRIKCLDYLEDSRQEHDKLEGDEARFDANFALFTHEIRSLLDLLLTIFEFPVSAVPPQAVEKSVSADLVY